MRLLFGQSLLPLLPLLLPCPFTTLSARARFIKEELATKLGIVDGARLEAVLPAAKLPAIRAFSKRCSRTTGEPAAIEDATGATAPASGTASNRGSSSSSSSSSNSTTGGSGNKNSNVSEPIDFSDALDGRWEAQLELARREAEFARFRDNLVTLGWTDRPELTRFLYNLDSTGRTAPAIDPGGGDGPPPLVSDSESEDSEDGREARGDGGGGGGARGGCANVAAGGVGAGGATQGGGGDKAKASGGGGGGKKRGGAAAKKRKGKRKPAPVAALAEGDGVAVAVAPVAGPIVAGTGTATGGDGGVAAAATAAGGAAAGAGAAVSVPSSAGPAPATGGVSAKRPHVGVAAASPVSAVPAIPDGSAPAAPAAGVAAGARGGNGQRRAGGAGSGIVVGSGVDVEDLTVVRDWVRDVAAGRVVVRAGQLQRYFRGRMDKGGPRFPCAVLCVLAPLSIVSRPFSDWWSLWLSSLAASDVCEYTEPCPCTPTFFVVFGVAS